MGNRFNTKVSATEPAAEDARAQHVKEIVEADYEAEVATSLPVVLDFYAKDSPACEALAPRLRLYTIYGPPEHLDRTVHVTKADAAAGEEHFDGKTPE